MALFNPRILDASIRDVSACLTDRQKAAVLLCALQHLPSDSDRYRTTVENAIQSILLTPGLPLENISAAHILRAKARIAAGFRTSAQQDLLTVMAYQPENGEVQDIIDAEHMRPDMLLREPDRPPRFSVEIWLEIARFLPRRDLKTLLRVPNVLSRIASQLLFSEIDLHFALQAVTEHPDGSSTVNDVENPVEELEAWHFRRSADILARILVDCKFSNQVKSLRVYFPAEQTEPIAFQKRMLINALPKLHNLRKMHCAGGREMLQKVTNALYSYHPRLQSISLNITDRNGGIDMPPFKHLVHFSVLTENGNVHGTEDFLQQSQETLRALAFGNDTWCFPATAVSVRHLSVLDINAYFPSGSTVFSEILHEGRQLETLSLCGTMDLHCTPSAAFRKYSNALPFLRHFSFKIHGLQQGPTADRDLAPAICNFLRDRADLRTFHLKMPRSEVLQRSVGFDASAWGVLPSLTGLKSLWITYPKELAPSLAGWLVPRSVAALTLDFLRPDDEDMIPFLTQMRLGAPPKLTYIGMTNFSKRNGALDIVEHGFTTARVVRIGGSYWTVVQDSDGSFSLEEWPERRIEFRAVEWLQSLDCADAVWPSQASKGFWG
ncbi:hypothetical protein CONPUDRAFT_130421, partial [Coniophora puteana RWD-64-598 SS2]